MRKTFEVPGLIGLRLVAEAVHDLNGEPKLEDAHQNSAAQEFWSH